MATSPNITNYYVGKGVMSWSVEGGDGSYRDLGNCSSFEITPQVQRLEHWSSRTPTKTKDQSVVQQKAMSAKGVLDEISQDNLSLALMGSQDSTGLITNILDLPDLRGALRFVGTNAVGEKQQVDLPTVVLTPSQAIGFIADGYASITLDGDVLASETGVF